MRFLSQLAGREVSPFEWGALARISRTFSLSNTVVLVRGRLFSSELVYSPAYPNRCELSAARPEVGATVIISTPGGRKVGRAVTDERGIFRIRLKPGVYVVTAPSFAISRKIRVERSENRSFDIVSVSGR